MNSTTMLHHCLTNIFLINEGLLEQTTQISWLTNYERKSWPDQGYKINLRNIGLSNEK